MMERRRIPERIWLQTSIDEDDVFLGEGVTRCDHEVNGDDTEYIRLDVVESLHRKTAVAGVLCAIALIIIMAVLVVMLLVWPVGPAVWGA